jgi:hypothetical protein
MNWSGHSKMSQFYRDVAVGVWSVVAPFVAAGLAAWFGYFFGVKRKQQELMVSDKFERVKKLHDAIVGLQKLCEVNSSQDGGDIGLSEEWLPKDVLRSPLEQAQNLEQVFRDAMFFLSRKAKNEIRALIDQVWRAARLELRKVTNPELGISTSDLYREISAKADSCIEMLHR